MRRLSTDEHRQRLKLPALLERMIANGTWRHPGKEKLSMVIPYITDPLVALPTHQHFLSQSGPLMGPGESYNARFCEYRGSLSEERELPWIDVEKALFIMINERIGDDVGVALYYRPSLMQPRVVASDWHSSPDGVIYRLVADTFEQYVEMLDLSTTGA